MTSTVEIPDVKNLYRPLFDERKHHPLLSSIRKTAWEQFNALGFPSTRHEDWKYTRLAPVLKNNYKAESELSQSLIQPTDITSVKLTGDKAVVLVFINGNFNAALSEIPALPKEVIISGFQEAEKLYPEVVKKYFAKAAVFENESITALNTALAQHGAFIFIPENTPLENTIELIFWSDSTQHTPVSFPRNLIVAGKNSKVSVVEQYRSAGKAPSFSVPVTEIFADENAVVSYYKIGEENEKAFHAGTTAIKQERNSTVNAITVTLNGALVRNNLNILLNGQGCEANMHGISILSGTQHVDNHTAVDHATPNCNSNELYKGILSGKSTGVFNGKIFVRKDAQKTNAFQSNNNVLLSDDATMNTKPQLEIFADDVKCSHGATIGQLDADALFYLRARGIDKDHATAMLVQAFALDVLEKINDHRLKENVEKRVEKKLMELL